LRCFFLLIFYPIFLRIQAFWFIGVWMIGEFLAAYVFPGDFIAHWAHVGGFVFGVIWSMGRKKRAYYTRGFWW
jgi:membrane associated rhomboid family serine protease